MRPEEMKKRRIYFVGIGGIGMSALARYFLHQGCDVAGYDRTETELTQELHQEGAQVHYQDSIERIPQEFRDPKQTVVIYTPAIPADHTEMQYFQSNGFEILKRSQMLGVLTQGKYVMAVAGTHGKSSTSTMIAHFNNVTEGPQAAGCAILGAISKNFNSNLVLGGGERVVVEADEYDRSFLRLTPDVAVVTSVDPDHLDIYGTYEAVKEAFAQFIAQIKPSGALIIKSGVREQLQITNNKIEIYSYSAEQGDTTSDFRVEKLELLTSGKYKFDIVVPGAKIEGCTLGVLGRVNVENCIAAVAAIWCAKKRENKQIDQERLRVAIESFQGLKRRWELHYAAEKGLYMDDYAHHPREITATLQSLREIMPKRHMTAIFQPHLYSRTNDLYEEFAEALSIADRVIVLPIYPARELPMPGVSAEMIAHRVKPQRDQKVQIVPRQEVAQHLATLQEIDVVVTLGAGDIDLHCREIAQVVQQKATR